MSSSSQSSLTNRVKNIAVQDAKEAEVLVKDALKSKAWMYPFKGIYYLIRYKQLSKPLRSQIVPALTTAISVFGGMLTFAYLPQLAVLAIFSGPVAVFSALFLTLGESSAITHIILRQMHIQDSMIDAFDETLLLKEQTDLVAQGRVIKTSGDGTSRMGRLLKKPFAVFNITAMLRYLMYLPLNFIPIIGPVLFTIAQARKFGPNAHSRYFQLKGMNKTQREKWAKEHSAEYTAFGIPAMLLEMIPFAGVFFGFSNHIGAALWAADLEKTRSRPVGQASTNPPGYTDSLGASNASTSIPSEDPPAYEDHEF